MSTGVSFCFLCEACLLALFFGDGPLRAEGELRFANRGDVKFLGWQQRNVVHALLRNAGAVLIPMSGFVLLEAASIGATVIAGSIEWHGEVVHDGQTGYLVDPNCPDLWLEALMRVVQAPDQGRGLGRSLQNLYRNKLTPEVAIGHEHALYEALTGKKIRL